MARAATKATEEAEHLGELLRDAHIALYILHNGHDNLAMVETKRLGILGWRQYANELLAQGWKPPDASQTRAWQDKQKPPETRCEKCGEAFRYYERHSRPRLCGNCNIQPSEETK